MVISETGAGGIYEWGHNATDAQWTLRYQSEVILADVDVALSNERISGLTLWHFFDFKVNDAAENHTACQYAPGVFPPTCTSISLIIGVASAPASTPTINCASHSSC